MSSKLGLIKQSEKCNPLQFINYSIENVFLFFKMLLPSNLPYKLSQFNRTCQSRFKCAKKQSLNKIREQ